MAHRAIAAGLAIAGLVLLPSRPLIALILLGAALVLLFNTRGAFGSGIHRAILAFVAALWLTLVGVVATLLGTASPEPGGNFLLLPGVILLLIGAGLLLGSLATFARTRRRRATWPGEVPGRRGR